MLRYTAIILTCALLSFGIQVPVCHADDETAKKDKKEIQFLFKAIEMVTGFPSEYLEAMNRFERNIYYIKTKKKHTRLSIKVPSHLWAGLANPNPEDKPPFSIQLFNGIGKDADGDGFADPNNYLDTSYSIAKFLMKDGKKEDQIRHCIWQYYQNPVSVDIVTHIAKILRTYGDKNLNENCFPIAVRRNFDYQSSWGAGRGYGGNRIHEGTDIFAYRGTPVLSTCYGYIELKGWNRFGGWRVGIRDANNRYHYFAHLSKFEEKIKKGDIVKPGDIIGYVGNTGYGPPGTSGKFPPHLHYGIYQFNGEKTYSFDPYPLLKNWEKEGYRKIREAREEKKNNQDSKEEAS